MKFYDKINIVLQSGKWWDGAVVARREAGIPYGGPRWGNGGKWWSIYLLVDRNLNTLLHLKFKQIWSAKDWERWESKEKYGRWAEDLYISIPVGTIVKNHENGQIIYQGINHGDKFELLSGGAGGIGNMHFKNSVLQYPDFGLRGEPAKTMEVDMEIQLLGDIWLIWFPSVGKSSIINSISNTKAKVADYHFTTLIPNLGSIKYEWYDYNIVDIPGIISGANLGKGLGLDFLRHILKARVFNFVLDISRYDLGILEFGQLWHEIVSYCHTHFVWSNEFGYNISDIKMSIYIDHEDIILDIKDQNWQIIISKKLIRTINKIDEVLDEEIQSEYISDLKKHIYETLVSYLDINNNLTEVLQDNIYMSCTIDYELMQNYKHKLTQKLNHWAQIDGYITVDLANISKETASYAIDITNQENVEYDMDDEADYSQFEKQLSSRNLKKYDDDPDDVVEEFFDWEFEDGDEDIEQDIYPQVEEITEQIDKSKTWLIYDQKLNKLVYQMMRGNQQAEHRFRNAIKTMWYIRRFHKKKIKVWDILVFKSIYKKVQNKALRYGG